MFAIPGIGRLTVDAILRRDYPIIQGVILLFSARLRADQPRWSTCRYTVVRPADPILMAAIADGVRAGQIAVADLARIRTRCGGIRRAIVGGVVLLRS